MQSPLHFVLVVIALLFATGCSKKSPPDVKAQLDAALAIGNPDQRDEALGSVAKAAVEASDGAVAMAAIVAIGSPDQKDAVAVASAKGFAKAGNDADATAIAKIIQNPVKRDKTLLELTK